MNEKIERQIKDNFKMRKEGIKKRNSDIDRINELKKDKAVLEYLELTSRYGENPQKKKFNEKDAIYYCYCHLLHEIEETNGIYVYLGTFTYYNDNDYAYEYFYHHVKRDSEEAVIRKYWNIESDKEIEIPIEKAREFEEKNIVIVTNGKILDSGYVFRSIQKEFFTDVIKTSQRNAVKKLIKKYKEISTLNDSDY